jgi:hypothetical protein
MSTHSWERMKDTVYYFRYWFSSLAYHLRRGPRSIWAERIDVICDLGLRECGTQHKNGVWFVPLWTPWRHGRRFEPEVD